MTLAYQYMAVFFNFSPTSSHLHPLQVENCDSNSQLVVDEDDNGKFRLEWVKHYMLMTNDGTNQKKDLGSFKLIYYIFTHKSAIFKRRPKVV